MKSFLFLKILVLALMLAGVFYVMQHLNSGAVGGALSAMGIDSSAGGGLDLHATESTRSSPPPGTEWLNICPTRVSEVAWPNAHRLVEDNQARLKWIAIDPNPRAVNTIEIEKWFSKRCEIAIQKIPMEQVEKKPFLRFKYVDHKWAIFAHVQGDTYFLLRKSGEPMFFISPDFTAAEAELVSLSGIHKVQ